MSNTTATHFRNNDHAACGCDVRRSRVSMNNGRTPSVRPELTDVPSQVFCLRCEGTKAFKAAAAAERAERAARREASKRTPLVLALCQVLGLDAEAAIDLELASVTPDQLKAALAIMEVGR